MSKTTLRQLHIEFFPIFQFRSVFIIRGGITQFDNFRRRSLKAGLTPA